MTLGIVGTPRTLEIETCKLLVHLIREEFGLTGTRVGCDRLQLRHGGHPLCDAGNVGMQMRKLRGVMTHPAFDPRAIMNREPTPV